MACAGRLSTVADGVPPITLTEAVAEAYRSGWLPISGGSNVYAREVEDVMVAFSGEFDGTVVGLPDEKWGDRVVAVVAGLNDLTSTPLMQYARDNLLAFRRPQAIHLRPEGPRRFFAVGCGRRCLPMPSRTTSTRQNSIEARG